MSNPKLPYWQKQVAQWQRSELSVAAYCRQHQVNYHNLLYWRSKLCEGTQSDLSVKETAGFTRVVSAHMDLGEFGSPQQALTIALPNGIKVSGLHAGNVSLLGDILRQLS